MDGTVVGPLATRFLISRHLAPMHSNLCTRIQGPGYLPLHALFPGNVVWLARMASRTLNRVMTTLFGDRFNIAWNCGIQLSDPMP
jgi:hypothetical protein